MSIPTLTRSELRATTHRRHKAHSPSRLGGKPSRGKRWRKRTLIGFGSLIAIAVLLAGGLFFYARWRFDQIPKVTVPGLAARPATGAFDILLVGSDSRSFVDNASEAAQFGSASQTTGQRSDVDIVARVDPALGEIRLLSIPRDTYVDIPGSVSGISGPNRINAAFNSGPALLVKTIEDSFHIPINDYAEVNFPGFQGMVDAVGGIGLDFADPVRDAYSGLNITQTGCQLVKGPQALALVRSRHLYYYSDGAWQEDYGSDWSRIQRQDAFFRALLPKLKTIDTNPGALNDFVGAATKNVAIDATLNESLLLHLASSFRHLDAAAVQMETLPTIPYTTADGQDVLLPAAGPDQTTIAKFLAFGASAASTQSFERPASPGSTTSAELTSANLTTSSVTVTTVAGGANPSDVVYNDLPEPWNPTPCTP